MHICIIIVGKNNIYNKISYDKYLTNCTFDIKYINNELDEIETHNYIDYDYILYTKSNIYPKQEFDCLELLDTDLCGPIAIEHFNYKYIHYVSLDILFINVKTVNKIKLSGYDIYSLTSKYKVKYYNGRQYITNISKQQRLITPYQCVWNGILYRDNIDGNNKNMEYDNGRWISCSISDIQDIYTIKYNGGYTNFGNNDYYSLIYTFGSNNKDVYTKEKKETLERFFKTKKTIYLKYSRFSSIIRKYMDTKYNNLVWIK